MYSDIVTMGDTDNVQGASVRGKGWVTFDDTAETASTVSASSTPRRLSQSESDTPGSLEVSTEVLLWCQDIHHHTDLDI